VIDALALARSGHFQRSDDRVRDPRPK